MMLRINARALLAWAVVCFVLPMAGQESAPNKGKQIRIPGAGGEPALVLQVSAEGWRGSVSVQDEKGKELQSLACTLLRDNAAATESELAAVREQFVSRFEAKDLDLDGHPDLLGIREFGAKWARYCVWFYDARQRIFVRDFLAEQMELLTNLMVNAEGEIVSSHIGPVNPWQAAYRIAGADGSRPERQLVPVHSCLVETASDGSTSKATVTTRYEGGQAVVQRQEVKGDVRTALDLCTAFGKVRDSQKALPKK